MNLFVAHTGVCTNNNLFVQALAMQSGWENCVPAPRFSQGRYSLIFHAFLPRGFRKRLESAWVVFSSHQVYSHGLRQGGYTVPVAHKNGVIIFRGNNLSHATCLEHVFFKCGE